MVEKSMSGEKPRNSKVNLCDLSIKTSENRHTHTLIAGPHSHGTLSLKVLIQIFPLGK